MSQTIYVVMADYDHQASYAVRAFTRKPAADTFAAKCTAYGRTAPECPSIIEDSDENDALWETWDRKRKRWEKRHPAGEHHGADSYLACPIQLEEA